MEFVTDTFTGTNGTLLENHTGEAGATWTNIASGQSDIQGNQLSHVAAVSIPAEYLASGVPTSAEYDVQAEIVVVDDTKVAAAGVLGRVDPAGTNDYYLVDYSLTTGRWRFFKRVNGAFTSLGTFIETLTEGVPKTVRLEIRNASKKVFIDGVERISSVDDVITGAGRPGSRTDGNQVTDAGSIRIDNFSASDPPVSTASANRFLSLSYSRWGVF